MSLQSAAGKVIITLLMLALLFMNIGKCSEANDELLNDLLGRAYICPRHADAIMFEFGPPPQCIQKQSSEQVKTVYITPYFKKILSEPFPLYNCVVEIETTATNMRFFGSKGIVSHEIQYTAIDEQDCRDIANQIPTGTHKLLKVGPYTYTNTTNNSITYQWCCRDHIQHNYKLIVRQLYATYNYRTSRFFSPNLPLAECDLLARSCVVNNQRIVWDNNTCHQCELLRGKTVAGEQKGDEIVSIEGQLAVTLNYKELRICGIAVEETYEGMYISLAVASHQPFRNLSNTLKDVYHTSNLFLTVAYVSQRLQELINDRFYTNWLAICHMRRMQYYHLKNIAS